MRVPWCLDCESVRVNLDFLINIPPTMLERAFIRDRKSITIIPILRLKKGIKKKKIIINK